MRAPLLVETPSLFPGRCYTCGSIQGPMVDTMVDDPDNGRVYLCVTNCLLPMARLAGCLDPVERAELEERVDGALAENATLAHQLKAAAADEMGLVEAVAERAAAVAVDKLLGPAAAQL